MLTFSTMPVKIEFAVGGKTEAESLAHVESNLKEYVRSHRNLSLCGRESGATDRELSPVARFLPPTADPLLLPSSRRYDLRYDLRYASTSRGAKYVQNAAVQGIILFCS
jgi:hypothetical protein